MKEFTIQEEFSVSVQQFFDLFFLTPKFKIDFHVARGDTDISVGDWKEVGNHIGNNKYERAIKFCSQVSDQPIVKKLAGGMSPTILEKQDYEFVGKELRVSSLATSSAGGFNTETTTNYVIAPKGDSANARSISQARCHVDVVVKSECKSRLFKGKVENMMDQAASQTFEQWIALVRTKIEEFKQQLQHQQNQLQQPQRVRSKQTSNLSQPAIPLQMHEYLMDTLSSSPSTTTENSECDTDDESYFDAHDHLISPPLSRTTTPTPPVDRSVTPMSHYMPAPMNMGAAGGIATLVHNMHKELQQVKSMTEVNTSRLLNLEASKPSSSHTSSASVMSSSPANRNEGLLPYLQRLDLLVQQQEEETQRSREKELEWRRRLEEMETKLETSSGKGRMVPIPGGWWGVVVFLLVWPVMAQKLWKYAKFLQPAVEKAFWKLFRR